jgi:hypothetical protein
VYTRGWDEYDERISGWHALQGSRRAWRTDSTGLHQTARTGAHRVVKGDPLPAYEFSTQVYGDSADGSATSGRTRRVGFFPVYVDEGNWLRASVDMDTHQFVVEEMRGGKRAGPRRVELSARKRLYPDATHSDNFSKRYTLRSPTLIGELRTVQENGKSEQPIPTTWKVSYRRGRAWKTLPQGGPAVWADALRLERGNDGDEIGEVSARVVGTSTYHLRAVKRLAEVLLFVDGKEVMRIPGDWPAARVGLSTRGMRARFDGLLRFDVPAQEPR